MRESEIMGNKTYLLFFKGMFSDAVFQGILTQLNPAVSDSGPNMASYDILYCKHYY